MHEHSGRPAVIDVRTAEEFAAGHVVSAVNLDLGVGSRENGFAARDPADR